MSKVFIERLDRRQLLSVSVSNGVLQVSGGSGDDAIVLQLQHVTTNGTTRTVLSISQNGAASTRDLAGITSIQVLGNGGNDKLSAKNNSIAWALPLTMRGGDGNDTLDVSAIGAKGATLYGDGGSDLLRGGGGADVMWGGSGNDSLYGKAGNDSLHGEAGNDVLTGDDGNDLLGGGDNNDNLSGGGGSDALYGGNGNDSLKGDGSDKLFGEGGFDDLGTVAAPGNATKMVYSDKYNLMFMMNSGSAIHVVDLKTGQRISLRFPTYQFTDIDLSPSGNYLYAADFGGESIGYGEPVNPSWVHRFNLQTRTWESRKDPNIAYKIEAVSDTRFLTLTSDQWVTLSLESWGSSAITSLDANSWSVYYGDIEYDPATGRVFHSGSGSSSSEINVFRVVGDTLQSAEGSGTYGTAQGHGGSATLATDGSVYYYGDLQVEALDVRHNLRVMPGIIVSASGSIALDENGVYYSAGTGAKLGQLPYTTGVFAWDAAGKTFYAYDPAGNVLHHYDP